jgi:hypothetical protein
VEVPLPQLWIALFTGIVATTLVPAVRRGIPRPVEKGLWAGLIAFCALGVMNVTNVDARSLTAAIVWGVDQVLNTILGQVLDGAMAWLYARRFELAVWLVIVAGVDVFALILMRSMRSAQAWRPRVRLREWMELPATPAVPATVAVPAADPLANLNRRLMAATLLLAAALLTRTVDASIWIRNVMLPRQAQRMASAAQAGKDGSRARLEALREVTAHLQFAARAWYDGAGQPALNGLTARAGDAMHTALAAGRALHTPALQGGEVVDIQGLLSVQSIGWYGPLIAGPTELLAGDHDVTEQQQTDRLAS